MRLTALRFVLLLGLAAPCEATAAEAPRIERALAAALDALAEDGDPVLAYEDAAVRADGPGFAVAIEGLRLAPDPDGYVDLGTVRFRLTPKEGDLYAVSDLRLPRELPYRAADGAVGPILRVPSLTFAGLWSTPLRDFLAAEAVADKVELLDAGGAVLSSVGGLRLTLDGEETAPGRWNRTSALALDGLWIGGSAARLSVGTVDYRSQAQGLTPLDFRDVARDLRSAGGGSGDPVQDWKIETLLRAGRLVHDGTGRIDLRDLSLRDPAGTEILRLARARLDTASSGFAGDRATVTLALRHDGLVPGPAVAARDSLVGLLLPRAMSLEAALEDLPGRGLARAFVAFAASEAPEEERSSERGTAEFVAAAKRLLLGAGSKLRLSQSVIETATARAALEGLVQAHPAAAFGVVAAFHVEIAGLDALIERLAAAPPESGAAQPWLLLQTLRAIGAPEPATDGATLYRYAISLSPDGTLLVNGKDLRFLMPGPHLQDN